MYVKLPEKDSCHTITVPNPQIKMSESGALSVKASIRFDWFRFGCNFQKLSGGAPEHFKHGAKEKPFQEK